MLDVTAMPQRTVTSDALAASQLTVAEAPAATAVSSTTATPRRLARPSPRRTVAPPPWHPFVHLDHLPGPLSSPSAPTPSSLPVGVGRRIAWNARTPALTASVTGGGQGHMNNP
jgi:hypothetical protein